MKRTLSLGVLCALSVLCGFCILACDGDSFVTPMPVDRSKPPHDFAIPYIFDAAGLDLSMPQLDDLAVTDDLATADDLAAAPDLEPQD
jgi:hypothetical protein